MNFLPKELEDIIIDYKYQLKLSEIWDKVNNELKIKSSTIILYNQLCDENKQIKYENSQLSSERRQLRNNANITYRISRTRTILNIIEVNNNRQQSISLEQYRLKSLISNKKYIFNFH